MWRIHINDYVSAYPRAGQWYTRVGKRRGWALGPAMLAAGLVVVIPLMLLTLAAVLTGAVVFFVLVVIGKIAAFFKGIFRAVTGSGNKLGPATGPIRHNVRVIQR